MRKINIGQKVICSESGVVGTVLRFYTPTSCEEQTVVETGDGREYHAPTRTWKPYKDGLTPNIVICDEPYFMGIDLGHGADVTAIINIDQQQDEFQKVLEKISEAKRIKFNK
jgi:hypothetical protein